ncbi:hypothetical protein K490DRAFT_64809 [Saccharata proteae CBS 121410]|uniref:C2H2-type domain-containing protein n=1 Tax=Saccharata proteae CBS 121410 TaxID=1314787 RepID=A0A9P4HU81_9PEZI|nr:hypothetical protein K490DRAFT_64809 [Saccharata proteae CBS 121410]
MTSMGIFGDLPPIAFNDDGPLNTNWAWSGYADRDPQWPDAHPSSYRMGNSLFAAGSPVDTSRMHNMSAMQRYLHGPERTLFTADVLHLELGGGECGPPRHFEFKSQQELQAPWPYDDSCHRQVSPDSTILSSSSYSSSHRLPSDELHFANPASRRSSDGASDYSSQGVPYTQYSAYATYNPMEVTMGGGSCNLREIQSYPSPVEDADHETMDHDDCTVDVKMSAEHDTNYYNGTKSEVEHEHDTYMAAHPDEEDTIRIREAESVQPCIKDDDDGDDDYKPDSVPAKRPRRRSSQCSNSSRSLVRPAKRHTSTRKASTSSTQNQTNRVTKRQSVSKSHHGSSSPSPKSSSSVSSSSANAPRPFPCPLAAYSCTSTFASKNEWKRHVSTQHIRLGFWRCDLCPTLSVGGRDDDNNTNEDGDSTNNSNTYSFNDFNRKDLFAQHLRRMHLAPTGTASLKSSAGKRQNGNSNGNGNSPSASTTATLREADLADALERCYCRVREAPTHSGCLFCNRTFEGKDSWSERMEHVGRHLEQSRKGNNSDGGDTAQVVGEVEAWREDSQLREWLVREGLVESDGLGGWKLGNGVPKGGNDGHEVE